MLWMLQYDLDRLNDGNKLRERKRYREKQVADMLQQERLLDEYNKESYEQGSRLGFKKHRQQQILCTVLIIYLTMSKDARFMFLIHDSNTRLFNEYTYRHILITGNSYSEDDETNFFKNRGNKSHPTAASFCGDSEPIMCVKADPDTI
jgi:hypothetical protein